MRATRPEAVPLGGRQYGPAVDLLTRAFVDYPLMQYTVPDGVKRERATRALYAAVLRYTLRYGDTYTTPDVAGAACWLPPERKREVWANRIVPEIAAPA